MNVGWSTSVIQRGRSGLAQYVFALLDAFSRQAERPNLTLFVLEQDIPQLAFASEYARIVSVSERFRSPIRNIFWHQSVLPALARAYRLDLLHVPSYRRMLWPRPCPLVATIHDLAPFRVARKYDCARQFYGRVAARWLAWRQDHIIAVSHTTRRDIVDFFRLPVDRVTVVHNGLDHGRFCPGAAAADKRFVADRYDLREPFFLYVSRLEHPGKNHVRLIEAFNRFKLATRSQWQLVFAGAAWRGVQAIHTAIGRSPFARDIRWLGFVEQEALPNLYRAAGAFVYPSLFEGFGFPPLEAMACACPVLCSTCGALGEVVGDAAALAEPEDVAGWARQLGALAAEPALRSRLRAAGLARAQRFNWEGTAARTLEVYATALQPQRAANPLGVEPGCV